MIVRTDIERAHLSIRLFLNSLDVVRESGQNAPTWIAEKIPILLAKWMMTSPSVWKKFSLSVLFCPSKLSAPTETDVSSTNRRSSLKHNRKQMLMDRYSGSVWPHPQFLTQNIVLDLKNSQWRVHDSLLKYQLWYVLYFPLLNQSQTTVLELPWRWMEEVV